MNVMQTIAHEKKRSASIGRLTLALALQRFTTSAQRIALVMAGVILAVQGMANEFFLGY